MCRLAIQSAPWPMFVLDCESKQVIEANHAAVARYKMSRDEMYLRGVEQVLPPERRRELEKLLDAKLDGPPLNTYSEHILPDRTLLPVEVRSFPLLWNGRPSRFFMVRDLLARPLRQRDPLVAEKLDLTGRVSGSAAHDFNNLLTVILAVAEQLQEGEGDPEQKIGLIAKTVRNAQQLAQQRLSFGGSQEARRERIDLNAVLEEQADTLGVLLGKQVELRLDFAGLWPVLADAAQWREVVLNLAVNARDAMPRGGSFSISTRNELLDGDDPGLNLARGRYIQLTVEDTGQGMNEETRRHAFEPYFTTKSRNRNSGLGLASVHSVVEQSGGAIRLTSAPDAGTRFDIFIPALAEDAQLTPAGGLVLLVEDAEELRRMIQDFLTARGHEVVACATAEVALKWARTHDRYLDLVICDLTLPDLPGDMLVEQLREQRPETRAIFMSGQLGIGDAVLSPPGTEPPFCLEKPFSLNQLAAAVADTLRRDANATKVDSIQTTG